MSSSSPSEIELRRRLFNVAPDLTLVGDEAGPASGEIVLLLHGGGQTRGAWRAVQVALAVRGIRSLALDQRGHGESSRADSYLLEHYADDLAAVVRAVGGRPALVGASLGGLASTLLLGERKGAGSALVLVDVTPSHAPSGADKIREFMQANPDGFASLNEAADAVAAYLPHRRRPKTYAGLEKNLTPSDDGRWHWRWDGRFLTGAPGEAFAYDAARVSRALAAVEAPALLIRGGASEIVTEAEVAEAQALLPSLHVATVPGAAHMVAGDDNDVFFQTIFDFLAPPRLGAQITESAR